MDEVIKCGPCGMEFHQSFLSAHVEAFHVLERQEEVVMISCLSCSFSVSVRHKNTMAQHCLVTGHSPEEVEVQFNSFLHSERQRICEILTSSVAILIKNAEEAAPTKLTPKKSGLKKNKSTEDTPESQIEEERISYTEQTINYNIQTSSDIRSKSRKRPTSSVFSENNKKSFIKVEETEETKDTEMKKENTLECGKCSVGITEFRSKADAVRKAVSHVLTHLPDLKLFRCCYCKHGANQKGNLKRHYSQKHAEVLQKLELSQDYGSIRSHLNEMFPDIQCENEDMLLRYLR